MSPVGAIFVPFPPETGTNMLNPLPPQSLNLSVYPEKKGYIKRHLLDDSVNEPEPIMMFLLTNIISSRM